jgi:putative membrane protein
MDTLNWKTPVFFDLEQVETIAEEEAAIKLMYTPPIVLPAEAHLETNAVLLAHEPEMVVSSHTFNGNKTSFLQRVTPAPRTLPYQTFSPWVWLAGSLGTLLICLLFVDAYYFLANQYAHSFFLGTLFLGLLATLTTAMGVLVWRAYQNIQIMRTISALQQEGERLMTNNGYGNGIHYINRVSHFYIHRPDIKARLDKFYITLNDTHDDSEICTLFSKEVIGEIDQQAYRVVVQRSKETALLVMISPVALLDTLFTLWRNVNLVRDIATLYGGRPGLLSSISLISAVLQNLIYADVSEMLAETLSNTFGNSVLSVVSTQAVQAVGSGVLTARVGLRTMQACRPLPFAEEDKPRLSGIRWEILSSITKLVESKKPDKDVSKN